MSSVRLSFGVEIELLLGHKLGTSAFKSWTGLANTLSHYLAQAGVRNHVEHRDVKETYREWSLMREVTIADDPVNNLYAIELVSPVFATSKGQWVTDVQSIFAVLDTHFAIYESERCSTHVHLSTRPAALTEVEAVHLAAAVLYYEPALDALMPVHRLAPTTYWCQSNRASHMLTGIKSVQGVNSIRDYVAFCFAERRDGRAVPDVSGGTGGPVALDTALGVVYACHELGAFCMDQAMNWVSASTRYGRIKRKTTDFVHGKVYKWNFASLYRGSKSTAPSKDGTLEFRLPPGSTCAEHTGMWVSLAAAFVAGVLAGARQDGATVVPSPAGTGASMLELKALLESGRVTLGWPSLGLLQDTLDGFA